MNGLDMRASHTRERQRAVGTREMVMLFCPYELVVTLLMSIIIPRLDPQRKAGCLNFRGQKKVLKEKREIEKKEIEYERAIDVFPSNGDINMAESH